MGIVNKFRKSQLNINDLALIQRKNGKYILATSRGKAVSPEFDWISRSVGGIRLCENDGLLYYMKDKDDSGLLQGKLMPRVIGTNEENLPEVYATAQDNGVTQIFIKGEDGGTLLLNSDRQVSRLFKKITPENRFGNRLAWTEKSKRGIEIISRDGIDSFDSFDSISEPDKNGVRIAQTEITVSSNDEESIISRKTVYTLLPVNFAKSNKRYKQIQKFDEDNYHVVPEEGRQMVVGPDGRQVVAKKSRRGAQRYIDDSKYGMHYDPFSAVNFDDVPNHVTRFKARGSEVIIHDGRQNPKKQNPSGENPLAVDPSELGN